MHYFSFHATICPLALKRFAKTVHTVCRTPVHRVIFYLVNIIHFYFSWLPSSSACLIRLCSQYLWLIVVRSLCVAFPTYTRKSACTYLSNSEHKVQRCSQQSPDHKTDPSLGAHKFGARILSASCGLSLCCCLRYCALKHNFLIAVPKTHSFLRLWMCLSLLNMMGAWRVVGANSTDIFFACLLHSITP